MTSISGGSYVFELSDFVSIIPGFQNYYRDTLNVPETSRVMPMTVPVPVIVPVMRD